jgi:hypothetical protein
MLHPPVPPLPSQEHPLTSCVEAADRRACQTGDAPCGNWTSASNGTGSANLGHVDRTGRGVERRVPVAPLLAAEPRRHRRQRLPVLLRRELSTRQHTSAGPQGLATA